MFQKLIRFIALIVCLVQSAKLDAREYPMQHYTIADGLPSNTIYDMYEDEEGIIWIGTDKGVSRYNGLKFENFTTADGLADNECFYFRKDALGRLWLASYNGELCFYKDGIFHNAKNTPYLKLPKPRYLRNIKILKDGSVAFFEARDPVIYILDKNKFTSFTHSYIKEKDLVKDNIISLNKLGANRFKIYFAHEILVLDSLKIFQQYKTKYTLRNSLNQLKEEYFVTIENKILDEHLNLLPCSAYNKISATDNVYRYLQSNKHSIVATNKGLFIDSTEIGLPNQDIHTIMINQNNDYWIGTKKNGLYVLGKSFLATKKINNAFDAPIMFANTQNEKLLFATIDGDLIEIADDSSKLIFDASLFKKQFNSIHYIDRYNTSITIGNFELSLKLFLFKIANGFIRTASKDLVNIKKLELDNTYILANAKSMLLNNSFTYFNNRLYLLLIDRQEFTGMNNTNHILFVPFKDKNDPIFGFAKGAKNDIWVSTLNAVFKIKDTLPLLQPQFGTQSFREIFYLNNKILGISHTNNLIICSNIESERIKADTIKATNFIWEKFYNLNDSTVLISTNNHLRILSISPNSPKLKYSIRVIENPFIPYRSEFIYTDSNAVYFFKNGAVSSFPIAYLLQNQSIPKVYFKTLETEQGLVYIKDSLEIDYKWSKNIKFNISSVSFYNKELSYEYSLSDNNAVEKWTSFLRTMWSKIVGKFG